jgi:hypothetical protein
LVHGRVSEQVHLCGQNPAQDACTTKLISKSDSKWRRQYIKEEIEGTVKIKDYGKPTNCVTLGKLLNSFVPQFLPQ